MKLQAALFDFNGTMLFDEKFQEKSWISFLSDKIGRSVSDEEFKNFVHGRNADVTLAYFLNRSVSRDETIILEEEKEKIYRKLCISSPKEFKLADGLPEFLDLLKTKGIPVTIATASGYNNVRFFFEKLALDRWFDFDRIVYNDGTIPGKPEPDIYLKVAEKLSTDISDCVVFEDAKSGIESARNAGAGKIIGIASMLNEDTLLSYGAAAAVSDYSNAEHLYRYAFEEK